MQILNRLKMELSNQEYFTDKQYIRYCLKKIYSKCHNLKVLTPKT